jgi:hypothetical protein
MKRSKFAISRDKDIKAQKPGKRAANKNRETYYEYRENRTDSDLRKKLEWGGTAESSETGVPVGGENQSSMYKIGGGVGDFKVGDKVKHTGDNSTGKIKEITKEGMIIWTKDEDGFEEESMQRYLRKMALGGSTNSWCYSIGGL